MNTKKLTVLAVVLASLGLAACQPGKPAGTEHKAAASSVQAPTVGERPRLQDDLYTHVNYEYLTTTKLPADKPAVNNFSDLNDAAEKNLKAILADLDKNRATFAAGSDEKNIADLYHMALDFKTRDQLGFKPVEPYLNAVNAVQDMDGFRKFLSEHFLLNYTPSVSFGVAQDQKNSDINILYVTVPETGLEKVYYEGEDEMAKKVRAAYQTYMQDVFVLKGDSPETAAKKAGLIMDLETKLMSAQLSKEEQQDQSKLYNEMTLEELDKLIPNLPYAALIKQLGLDKAQKIVVQQPKALQKLNELATPENLEAFKAQNELAIIKQNATYLNKDLIKAGIKYLAAYIGIEHLESDDKLAFQVVDGKLGELLGKLYVAKHFSPEIKADVLKMTDEIRQTYARRINELDWLTPETKARAQKKLETLGVKIGYPDKWKTFPGLNIKSYEEGGNLVEAVNAINAVEVKRNLEKLNQAPDRTEWAMTPQTVNAYYNPLANEIAFPAAFLQAPFYSPAAGRAENLGAVGSVIAHEVSHAFDSTGAQFDEKGNLNNWWTEQDLTKFQEKVKQAAAIFNKLEAAPGYHVNGDISTGEIMADLGGLTVVLDIAAKENLDLKKVFESYAQTWRSVQTQESLIANLTDEHPPGKFRVNNIANLTDPFYAAYGVKEGDKMYVAPAERLKVW